MLPGLPAYKPKTKTRQSIGPCDAIDEVLISVSSYKPWIAKTLIVEPAQPRNATCTGVAYGCWAVGSTNVYRVLEFVFGLVHFVVVAPRTPTNAGSTGLFCRGAGLICTDSISSTSFSLDSTGTGEGATIAPA